MENREKKIRILMVMGNTGRGGTQAYVMNVIRNIDHSRFLIDVAVNESKKNGYDDEITNYNGKILFFPKFTITNILSFAKSWEKLFDDNEYDIVEAHATNAASVFLHIARKRGIHTIAHSHSAGYRGNRFEKIIKRFFSKLTKAEAEYWFACSDLAARRLFGNKYEVNSKYYDIPNAINVSKYYYDEHKRSQIRKNLGIEENVVLIGHVGTFSEPKNHAFLIDIFDQICKYTNIYRIILVGDGELRPVIQRKVNSLDLQDRVYFTGNVENVNDYMMAMDILVFPSIFEGFPVTLIEAQASGLQCFISDTISTEVDVTSLIHRLSIKLPAKEWACRIINTKQNDRKGNSGLLSSTKYDMDVSIRRLSDLYEMIAE